MPEEATNLLSWIESLHVSRGTGVLHVEQAGQHMQLHFGAGELFLRRPASQALHLARHLALLRSAAAGAYQLSEREERLARQVAARIARSISSWKPSSVRFAEGDASGDEDLLGPLPTSWIVDAMRDCANGVSTLQEIPAESPLRPSADAHTTDIWQRHFQLTGDPFSLSPDPGMLFLSDGHREALAALQMSLLEGRGLTVMIGEVGTGKTTLLYSLLSELDERVETAYISNTTLGFDEILESALKDLGVIVRGTRRLDLLESLNSTLKACAASNKTVAFVIDEAQSLSDDCVEQLRLLLNFETFESKLLQIVLVGQPELDARLREPHMRQIADRVAVRCNLEPLRPAEARRYIAHRLAAVGGSSDIFSRRALEMLIRRSAGVPRRINVLCHNAMLFAYAGNRRRVGGAEVSKAIHETQSEVVRVTRSPWQPTRGRWARWAALLAVGAVLALLGWQQFGHGQGVQAAPAATAPAAEVTRVSPATTSVPASNESAEPTVTTAPEDSDRPAVRTTGTASTAENVGRATPRLRVRAEPYAESPVMGSVGEETDVVILDSRDGWLKVRTSEGEGWVSSTRVARFYPETGAATREFASSGDSGRLIRVAEGQSISSIATIVYGEYTPGMAAEVQAANPEVRDPDLVYPGDLLFFPFNAESGYQAPARDQGDDDE